MADLNTCFTKKRSAMIRGVEYKGKIIQSEGFLVVVTGNKIVRVELLHSYNTFARYALNIFQHLQYIGLIRQSCVFT